LHVIDSGQSTAWLATAHFVYGASGAAQLWLWKELKLAVEPAAALPLAALHTGAYAPREGEKICLIVCGANVDPASLA